MGMKFSRQANPVLSLEQHYLSRPLGSFTDFRVLTGEVSAVPGWSTDGQIGWTMNSSGLYLARDFSQTSRGAMHALPDGANAVRVLVGSGVMILRGFFDPATNKGASVWTYDSNGASALSGGGFIQNGSVDDILSKSGGSLRYAFPHYAEVLRKAGLFELRHWVLGNARPTLASVTFADDGSVVAREFGLVAVVSGCLVLNVEALTL